MILTESLDVKTEMHDVAVLYNVVLTLYRHFAGLFARLFGFIVLIIS